jgi:hypothetical protein
MIDFIIINSIFIRRLFFSSLFFFIPFLLFFWMVPYISDKTMGMDYVLFPIFQQYELLFSLKTGSFPLYAPGFAGGQTAAALTLAQIYHPISPIAQFLPNYWNGQAEDCNTLIRLLTLGCAHLLLYLYLCKLRVEKTIAFVLSLITVYNLRMLDLFRYGPSLESWTGQLFLCAVIGLYNLNPTKYVGPLSIIGAMYWLICSGHPQMMYYGLLCIGLFTLVVPYFNAVMLSKDLNYSEVNRFWIRVGLYSFLGIGLSSLYIVPFYFDFMLSNTGRVGQIYLWADGLRDTLVGTVNNFVFPLRSDVHGAFGGSTLISCVIFLPILRCFGVKIKPVIWFIWGIILFCFLHIQGGRTLVHFLTWKYLPFASSFRIAGRISMIMPIFFLLMLTWMVSAEKSSLNFYHRKFFIKPQMPVSIISLLVFGVYACLPTSITGQMAQYSAIIIRKIPQSVELLILLYGMLSLLVFSIYDQFWNKTAIGIVLACLVGIQVMFTIQYGNWMSPKIKLYSLDQMYESKKKSLEYLWLPGAGLSNASVVKQSERSYSEPFLGKVYHKYISAKDNEQSFSLMVKGRTSDQVVIEGFSPDMKILKECESDKKSLFDIVKLKYSSYNKLIFEVDSACPGFFGFSYPYSKNWRAKVNGHFVKVYRANGGSHAVQIEAGNNQIEFYYWSTAEFWGKLLSCFFFVLIGFIIFSYPNKLIFRFFISGLFVVVAGIVFILWYNSLYSGENLQTKYTRVSRPPSPPLNIAYSKKTNMMPIRSNKSVMLQTYPYSFNSGRGVDGNVQPGHGFKTDLQPNPYWQVDLFETQPIQKIILYGAQEYKNHNRRPLIVSVSNDSIKWQKVSSIQNQNQNQQIQIEFKDPISARFIKVSASGYSRLSLDEVEVYPPVNQ